MLDGLAFLPLDDVLEGLAYLRDNTPEGLESLIDYFDSTYVSGGYRRIQPPPCPDGSVSPICVRRMPPIYEPSIWNVHDITLAGGSRTNNICEGWNNAFMNLVGHAHPTIWRAIEVCAKIKPWSQLPCSVIVVATRQPSAEDGTQSPCRPNCTSFVQTGARISRPFLRF